MIPPANHPRWVDLIKGTIDCEIKYLAAKILLARLRRLAELEPTPEKMQSYVYEIRDLYSSRADMSKVKQDIQQIFAKEGAF